MLLKVLKVRLLQKVRKLLLQKMGIKLRKMISLKKVPIKNLTKKNLLKKNLLKRNN